MRSAELAAAELDQVADGPRNRGPVRLPLAGQDEETTFALSLPYAARSGRSGPRSNRRTLQIPSLPRSPYWRETMPLEINSTDLPDDDGQEPEDWLTEAERLYWESQLLHPQPAETAPAD